MFLTFQHLPIERIAIDGFFIFYKRYGFEEDYKKLAVAGSASRRVELTGLGEDTPYTMYMQSFNDDGQSEPSNTVVKRTLGRSLMSIYV